jgi:hypothetical protein
MGVTRLLTNAKRKMHAADLWIMVVIRVFIDLSSEFLTAGATARGLTAPAFPCLSLPLARTFTRVRRGTLAHTLGSAAKRLQSLAPQSILKLFSIANSLKNRSFGAREQLFRQSKNRGRL